MATKRRRPGAPPRPLTPEQQADADRCEPIGARVALYYARRQTLVNASDLLSAANEAVSLAVCTYHARDDIPDGVPLDTYVQARVRSTLKTLLKRSAERPDTPNARVADAGSDALDEYALTGRDPGNFWQDTRAQQVEQYDEEAQNAAAALALGGAGEMWHMGGEDGLVLRLEHARGIKVLHDEVARLAPGHATIVDLRFFQGLKRSEVAKKAGVSESTVFRMIGEAIPILRARLVAQRVDPSILDGR
jgi:RNA polymerase sigma factor (sigma-70 family)